MKKILTWSEMTDLFWKHNEEAGVKVKGSDKDAIHGIVVFKQESFTEPYTETQRSYRVSSNNKAFIAGQISNSIFADCLDGTDLGVRLDWYMHGDKGWKVDYCYMEE